LNEVRKAHHEVLSRVVRAIRSRRYSIRTEQAYEAWICRFIGFHGGQAPERMGGTGPRNGAGSMYFPAAGSRRIRVPVNGVVILSMRMAFRS
jgi:hypothetical protein